MFRNMEYIYAVYQAGSFSAAAKTLYVSQPCLSAIIKKTETQLGVPIFDRKSKPLQLTEYGVQYIAYLEKMRDLERELEQYLNDIQGLHIGSLSIGTNNVFASFILPQLICSFKTMHPGVQVQMVEGSVSFLEDALAKGTLDLVLDNCPMDTTVFSQHLLGSEQLLLAAHCSTCASGACTLPFLTHADILSQRHLEAEFSGVSMACFADAPFIALRPGNDTRIRMDSIFRNEGVIPQIQLEVDQLATAYNIACSGLGLTLVSDTLLRNTPAHKEMRYYKLRSTHAVRPIYLYHKRSRYVTIAMQKFMDMTDLFPPICAQSQP